MKRKKKRRKSVEIKKDIGIGIPLRKNVLREPPGTISYTGPHKGIPLSVELIAYDEHTIEKIQISDIESYPLKDKNYWINIIGLWDINQIKSIGKYFKIHLMDLEDIVHVSQRSKIEKRDDYLFSVFKMMCWKENSVSHEHISMILKENILITFQEVKGDVFEGVRARLENKENRVRKNKIPYLYYCLLDALVDEYSLVTHSQMDLLNELEWNCLETNSVEIDDLYKMKREILFLANAVSPIQDSLDNFMEEPHPFLNEEWKPHYQDIADHLHQILDSLRVQREILDGLYEMQMAKGSNDMNRTMMTLTIFSAVFIPLSFLAGVFGMNFRYFPGLDEPMAIYIFFIVCGLLAIGMVSYFKIKRK